MEHSLAKEFGGGNSFSNVNGRRPGVQFGLCMLELRVPTTSNYSRTAARQLAVHREIKSRARTKGRAHLAIHRGRRSMGQLSHTPRAGDNAAAVTKGGCLEHEPSVPLLVVR
jgi:hypothetical protein